MEKLGLLEELRIRLKFIYLSDIGISKDYKKLFQGVEHIDAEKYPLSEWGKAFEYIVGKETMYECSDDVKKALLKELEKNTMMHCEDDI